MYLIRQIKSQYFKLKYYNDQNLVEGIICQYGKINMMRIW